jgi:hypothetical protein
MKDEKENESENCLPAIASGNQEWRKKGLNRQGDTRNGF